MVPNCLCKEIMFNNSFKLLELEQWLEGRKTCYGEQSTKLYKHFDKPNNTYQSLSNQLQYFVVVVVVVAKNRNW